MQRHLIKGEFCVSFVCLRREHTKPTLLTGVAKLVDAGIDFLVIASNTGHIAFPAIRATHPTLPVLHIADCTARAIIARGFTCVGLLGTEPTMKERSVSVITFRRAHVWVLTSYV